VPESSVPDSSTVTSLNGSWGSTQGKTQMNNDNTIAAIRVRLMRSFTNTGPGRCRQIHAYTYSTGEPANASGGPASFSRSDSRVL
jgi:hypothetical protein